MAVCDPEGGMHELWQGVLPRQVFADAAAGFDVRRSRTRTHLRELIERHADELAAVIVEPVVQGAGGMRFHSPVYLRVLREACDAHDVLLVFDEIATGFGRTGEMFAAEHAGVTPDVMCVGKALTGGYLTMAAALCTARVADGDLAGRGAGARARPDLHGQPARRRRGLRLDRPAARPGLAGRGQAHRDRAAGGTGSGARSCPVCGRYGCSVRSGSCSSTTRSTWRRRRAARSARACGCARSGTSSTRCRHTSAPMTKCR